MLVKLNIRAIALMVLILSTQHSMCISFNVSFFVALEFKHQCLFMCTHALAHQCYLETRFNYQAVPVVLGFIQSFI